MIPAPSPFPQKPAQPQPVIPHRTGARISTLFFLALCMFFLILFSALGIWQLQRLQWKNALINRVEARIHLNPIPAPSLPEWPWVKAESHEYLPVTARGYFLNDKEVLVSALTDHGAGYWLMVPLQQTDGTILFINRGFLPMDRRDPPNRPDSRLEGQVQISGLLRMSEGSGFFPRSNDPERERWYSRQLEAMAHARSLDRVAPYFIDADARPDTGGVPIGGLTVVNFRNAHLSYAITWFVLAAGMLAAMTFLLLHNRKIRKNQISDAS